MESLDAIKLNIIAEIQNLKNSLKAIEEFGDGIRVNGYIGNTNITHYSKPYSTILHPYPVENKIEFTLFNVSREDMNKFRLLKNVYGVNLDIRITPS